MFNSFIRVLAKIAIAPTIWLMSLAGYSPQAQQTVNVGAAPQFTAAAPTTLYGSGIGSSDTSIKVTSLTTPNGYAIQTADLVGGAQNVYYATIEPSSSLKETVSCSGDTQNPDGTAILTGCTRGLLFTYPYTASTTLARPHSGGSAVALSNSPQLYNDIITYINNAVIAGGIDAQPGTKGVVDIATAIQAASHAQNGSGATSAYLALTSNISSSTRKANTAQVVVSSSTDGYIDSSYINPANFAAFGTVGKNLFFATSSQTWTVPTGVTLADVQCVGGGGGGGGTLTSSPYSPAGGGGGGAYIHGIANVTGLSTVAITVGLGGLGAPSSSGGTGGDTSFGNFFLAKGGSGGAGNSGSSGPLTLGGGGGGTASTTASTTVISIAGQGGGPGWATAPTSNIIGMSGKGGDSFWGKGNQGIFFVGASNSSGSATSTTQYGAGGNGAIALNSAGAAAGGGGTEGACLITW